MFPNPFGWEEERQLFPGLSAIIPFTWFLLCKNSRMRQPLAVVMLVTVVILFSVTINVSGHTLYWLIYQIPGFSALRVVERVILVIMLPLAALFGMMIDDWVSQATYRWPRYSVVVALSAFLVVECSLVSPQESSPASWQARLAAIETHLPDKLPLDAVLAVATPPTANWYWQVMSQTDAEFAAVTLGIKTLNGYSGNVPPTWRKMSTCVDVADNIRAGRHFLIEHGLPEKDVMQSQIILVGFGSCEVDGLAQDPALRLSHAYHFEKEGDGGVLTGEGFSIPESWGRWTDARNAFLFFSLADLPQGRMSIAVDAITFSPATDRRQEVTVTANGRDCGRLVLADGKQHDKVSCPAGALRSGNNAIRFRIAHPARPIDLGINNDPRYLGFGLKVLTLAPAG